MIKSYSSIVQSDTWLCFCKARRTRYCTTGVNNKHENIDKLRMSIARGYTAIPQFKFRFVSLGVTPEHISISLYETTAQLSILNYFCASNENVALDTDAGLSR